MRHKTKPTTRRKASKRRRRRRKLEAPGERGPNLVEPRMRPNPLKSEAVEAARKSLRLIFVGAILIVAYSGKSIVMVAGERKKRRKSSLRDFAGSSRRARVGGARRANSEPDEQSNATKGDPSCKQRPTGGQRRYVSVLHLPAVAPEKLAKSGFGRDVAPKCVRTRTQSRPKSRAKSRWLVCHPTIKSSTHFVGRFYWRCRRVALSRVARSDGRAGDSNSSNQSHKLIGLELLSTRPISASNSLAASAPVGV